MSAHLCHAEGCQRPVPRRRLMCAYHWRMVPEQLQREVWATYVSGQEQRMDPTPEYLDAAMAAVDAVALAEKA